MEPHEVVVQGDLLCFRSTRDGQVTEHWGLIDAMLLMQQLGAIPQEAPA